MIVHGPHLVQKGHVDIKFKDIFADLFGIRQNVARDLHTLLTRSKDELFDIVKPSEMMDGITEYGQEINQLRDKLRILINSLDLDDESYEWIKSLTCLLLGSTCRTEFMARKFELPQSSNDIFKAMCSHQTKDMGQLFTAISKLVRFISFIHQLLSFLTQILIE